MYLLTCSGISFEYFFLNSEKHVLLFVLADASPQETKGPESEQTEKKLDLETSTSPETSASLKENISKNENGSKPCLEEQKINPSPTKEPAPACTSHEEEPMEVLFTEKPSAEAHGVTVEPEVSTAENTPVIQSQMKIVQEQIIPPESHTKEMDDITIDGDHRCLAKLSSLVEERTSLQQPPRRQPEGLLLVGQGTSQLQALTQAVSRESISNVPSSAFKPITPKIGMGKPAISKRKFSPGRPRVKQVSHILYNQLCVDLSYPPKIARILFH